MSLAKNSIHIVTQAKGGVGKSFISRLLIQYLRESMSVFCFDADPLNDGLVSFKGLNAHKLETKLLNGNLDSRSYYDPMFETILLKDSCFLIDSGSSTHINFINYIKGSDILNLFKEENRKIYFHVPLAGNQDFNDCYRELIKLAQLFPGNSFVVWENEFHGDIEQDYKVDQSYKSLSNIIGHVELKNLQSSPLLYDIEMMNKEKLLFNEIEENSDFFGAIIRRRLMLYKESIYKQLNDIFSD